MPNPKGSKRTETNGLGKLQRQILRQAEPGFTTWITPTADNVAAMQKLVYRGLIKIKQMDTFGWRIVRMEAEQ